jgi:xylulokinase
VVLGLDVGTSACKAILVDDEGRSVALARAAYHLSTPGPGRVELDPEVLWGAVAGVVARVGRRARRLGLNVSALACSVSGDEAVMLDAEGMPVGPAVMALDTRATDAASRWATAAGAERIYRITGLPPHPAHPLIQLLWLRQQEPERYGRVARVLCWEEYIALRLGLPAVSDPSVAARTMAWDVAAVRWSDELLDRAVVSPRLFPEVRPSASVVGEIPSEVAEALSLPAGVALVTGGLDQAVATLGAGVTEPGQAMVGSGSWEALTVLTAGAPQDAALLRASGIALGPFVVPGRLAALATQAGGGSLVAWLRDLLAPGFSIARFLRLASDQVSELLVLPHIEGSYSPWMDPGSRSAIAGLALDTTRGRLVRAVLEGITFELRLNLERLEAAGIAVAELRCTGGGGKSRAWVQLKADVLERPMVLVDVAENGAFGAALLAGAGIGLFPAADVAARRFVHPVETVQPRPTMVERYGEVFERYRELYPALRSLRASSSTRDS